jgi:7-carboxy-7-deazaguanine synthase
MILEVSEIFDSIQGEGKFAGHPSTFVRLRRCNLACPQCDERQTWDKEHPEYNSYETFSVDQLYDTLRESEDRIVITGGEPLIWQRQLEQLVKLLRPKDIEIETNGTIPPILKGVHYNVSPKLSSFHDSSRVTQRQSVLIQYSDLSDRGFAIFKFVVQNDRDLTEVDNFVNHYSIDSHRVYLMAEGITPEAQLDRLQWLLKECLIRNYNYSPRLHILAYGNQRGT